jgi:hypothetical protein
MSKSARCERSFLNLLRRRRPVEPGPATRTILPPSDQQPSQPEALQPGPVADGDELRARAWLRRRLAGGER